jgi:hypothetical protein
MECDVRIMIQSFTALMVQHLKADPVAQISTADWIRIVIASGLVAAILTKFLDGLFARFARRSEQHYQDKKLARELDHKTETQKRELVHAQEMQRAEQEHQSKLQGEVRDNERLQLLIAAHDKAREALLENAVGVRQWLRYELNTTHGFDHDFSSEYEPAPSLSSITEALHALSLIEGQHPTRSVRRTTSDLRGKLSAHYGDIYPELDRKSEKLVYKTGAKPSVDQFFHWLNEADTLIELIHTPPALNEVQPIHTDLVD